MHKEEGGFFTKSLLCILILGLLIYGGTKVGMPWIKYYSFKESLKEISMYDVAESEEKTMKRIMESAMDKGVPVKKKDVKIEYRDKSLIIKVKWDHEVLLFGGRIKLVLPFSIDTGLE